LGKLDAKSEVQPQYLPGQRTARFPDQISLNTS
jgi:hypothetical protein